MLHCVCVLPLSSPPHGAGSISSVVPLGNTAWLPHACCRWVTSRLVSLHFLQVQFPVLGRGILGTCGQGC